MQIEESAERSTGSRTCDSAALRDFYERRPYPAPLTSLDEHRELYANPERRRALFHLIWPAEQPRADLEILVAGCGSSQAARYALREPDAHVTGIDVSETSLNHSRQLKQKHQLGNLTLHQLSVLDVQKLEQTFDLIVCTGVLHHLPDPEIGLQSLRSVLKRDGAMQIMVYAQYGRTGIYMIREYCQLLGITPSDQELSTLASALAILPEDHPLNALLRGAKDFRHPDALADALLHPQDRAYTVRQVYEWLDRCRMSFGRWIEQAPYSPECGALARTPHAERLRKLPERARHAAAELFRGTISQHKFVAYRDDRTPEPQPIRFDGEQCLNYVPIRLPWTKCVRDGLPPGTVAVLLNQAHRHPDLILTITGAQHRLVNDIDGKRTLGEIVRSSPMEEARALKFLSQLWQYDQIVFDASMAAVSETDKKVRTQISACEKKSNP